MEWFTCQCQECSLLLFIVGLQTLQQLLSLLEIQSGAWGTSSERTLTHFTSSRENWAYFLFRRGCSQNLWLYLESSKHTEEDRPKHWAAVCSVLHFSLYYLRNYIHNNLCVFFVWLLLITKSMEGFQTRVSCLGSYLFLKGIMCVSMFSSDSFFFLCTFMNRWRCF